jgi:hypothetical protein
VGGLPSSRLTRILQEKAEALKKQRQAAEAALRELDEQTQRLDQLGITPGGAAEKVQAIRELQRRSDWEAVETQAKALLDYLSKTVPANLEDRRKRTVEALGRLSGLGIAVPAEVGRELEELAHPPADESWSATVARLAHAEETLRRAESDHVAKHRERAVRVAKWAELSPARLAEFERRLDESVFPADSGRLAESLEAIDRLVRDGLPEAGERRRRVREAAATLVAQAKEHGASPSHLEVALDSDAGAPPVAWPETVAAIERAFAEVGDGLRERCTQALEGLKASVEATVDYGVDPGEARQRIEEALARLATVPPLEIVPLFAEARRSAEEPVVTVIAGLLDEVRPRIVEARRLGRDPSEVFASMNRAREALRLKIYSEAFAAGQEALDRVSRLTEDLDAARDELQALEEMLGRFRKVGFSSEAFEGALARIRNHLERGEVQPARELLRDTVVHLGRDALQFFLARWSALDKVREYARDRGFLPAEADRGIAEARELLDRGELAEAAERIALGEVALRTAAGPHVARRVEEMEQGLSEITDEALTAPVRRLLADADVSLRVKEDLVASIESLRRAERDFAAVFAAHASALVEVLESEGKVLESMGGASDEIQRQIDEVQQIFNMGDFVKASRASQEIRTRAQQQQLLRSEDAVSHAKLSLVELETMGLDLSKFRAQLEESQAAGRAGRSLDAYKTATRLEESAARARATAHEILDGIARAQELLGRLRESGADPAPFYEPLRNARLAVQALDFDAARGLLEGVQQQLVDEEARLETSHLLTEIGLLVEDGRRLSTPMEPFAARLEQLKTERATAPAEATRTGARILHEELIAILRPILDENLRALERDLDVARTAGVELSKILAPLSEARRRIALPVPVGAAALLDSAHSELTSTRGFVEHAERVAKRAREALAQSDLLHVEATPQRQEMERLEKLLAEKQYARVVELGGPLERDLLQATYQHVSKTLAGFQATVTRIRHAGVDTSLAENLLHQARMALDEGRPVEALQLASRSESELERAELQRRIAEGSIEAAGKSIARSVSEGTLAPVAAEEFEAARVAFQQHAYPDVLVRAMDALDALAVAREGHRRAGEAIASAEGQVAEAVENGADVGEASRRMAEGRHFLDVGQYSEAVRAGREATEMGRWAIERLFAAPLGELRRQVETARQQGLTTEVDPLDAVVSEGEAALRGREWSRVREAVKRGNSVSQRTFEAVADGRWREVESEYGRASPPTPAEKARREEVRRQLGEARERRDFGAALSLVRAELEVARHRHREEVDARMAEFKDRLWVGERLGIDTTPVMQTFSEARVAVDSGRLDEAESILGRASAALEPAIREPFRQRLKDLQTEVTFAEEGLHVSVGLVRERLKEVEEVERSGRRLDAGRLLLKAEEELNLRKSLHRELMNLHYLIDAALARAHERRLDTSAARALLTESIRLRDTDYPGALEKAREALKKLQEEGAVAPETVPAVATGTTPFWPFRRPPSEP